MRRLAVIVLVICGYLIIPSAAQAAVVRPLTLAYDQKVYGKFLMAGNTVLVCPPVGTPTIGRGSCIDGSNRADPQAVNDWFDMRYADVDSDSQTFNSSTSRITIPPGAAVDYARLSWAGNTGVTSGAFGSVACTSNSPPFGYPRATAPPRPPAAINPGSQSLRVTVGSGSVNVVAPQVFVNEPTPSGTNNPQYYSGQAEVTSLFSSASGITDVTVGNVWTPRGFGCFGGWSLIVVYKFDSPDPTFAPDLREIFIYEGHVRQGASDPATNVNITGFRNAGGQPRVGVTSYEGDYNIMGDQFRINGTVLAEPATGSTSNFFISNANGEVDPAYPNNYSVDAKAWDIPVGIVNPGDTSVRLTFSTTGDSYLAQQVAFSVPIPELRVTKEVCQSRDSTACTSLTGPWAPSVSLLPSNTAYWRITVTNPTGGDADGVTLIDPEVPGCVTAAGTFTVGGGQTRRFYCSSPNLTETKSNTVQSRFLPPDDPTVPRISPPSTAVANIATMTLDKEVCQATTAADCTTTTGPWVKSTNILYAGTAYWRVKLTNTGGAALTGVSVSDTVAPGCAQTVDLAAGETRYLYCQSANVTAAMTNTASAVFPAPPGSPPGTPSTDVPPSSASVGTYDVQLTKEVCTSTVAANCASATGPWAKESTGPTGSTAYWRLVLTHRGSVPVTGITITDPVQPSCAQASVDLAVRETKTFYCSTPNVTTDKVNQATAAYTPPGAPAGTPQTTVTDQATYRVYGLTILKQVCGSRDPANCTSTGAGPWVDSTNGPVGSNAIWRITVQNTGTITLNGISIVDPVEPSCVSTFNLTAGASRVLHCTTTNVTNNVTNSASAQFTPPGSTTPVTTAPNSASYNVYGLTLVKEVCTGTAAQCSSGGNGIWAPATTLPIGSTAYWRITATNVGATTITGITIADTAEPTCQAAADAAGAITLTASDSRVLYCSTSNVTTDKINVASARYIPPGGGSTVIAASSAQARPYGITVVKQVCGAQPDLIADCSTAAGPWEPTATGPLGSTAYWQITVRNIGTVAVNGINIADPNEASCVRSGLDVPVGGQVVYYCSTTNVQSNITNTPHGTFTMPGQPPSTVDGVPADYEVFGLTLNKEVCESEAATDCGAGGAGPWVKASSVAKGGNAFWRITVTNAGDVPIDSIVLRDATEASCQTAIDAVGPFTLTEGDSRAFYCTSTGVSSSKTNTVDGEFPPPGRPVGTPPVQVAPSSAAVTVYELMLVKEVCSSTVAADCAEGGSGVWLPEATGALGSTAYWRITATNTGEVPLTQVSVSDPVEGSCGIAVRGTFDLAPGGVQRFYCATAGVTTNVTNVATASYPRPSGGSPITTPPAEATYSVFGLTIVKEVCGSTADADCQAGGMGPWLKVTSGEVDSTAYWRIVVHNVGSLSLSGVTIDDTAENSCAATAFTLAPSAVKTVYCQTDDVATNTLNTATANYTPPGQTTPISTPSTAEFQVHGVKVIKEVCTVNDPIACGVGGAGPWAKTTFQDPPDGGATAYWRISVVNIGGQPLTGVAVVDADETSCAQTVDLPVSPDPKYVYCSTAGLTTNKTNTAHARYTPPDGGSAITSPPDSATFQTFGLLLVKEVCDNADPTECDVDGDGPWQTVVSGPVGDTAYWRIRIVNNGGVAITGISLTDTTEASCAAQFPNPIDLNPGEERKFGCTTPNVRTDKQNTVSATYTPPSGGPPTTMTADALFRPYGLEVLKEVCSSIDAADCGAGGAGPWLGAVRLPVGSTAYWRVTATNTGATDLVGVQINDSAVPGCQQTIDLPTTAPVQYVYCNTPGLTGNQVNSVTGSYTPPGDDPKTTPPSVAVATVYGVSVVKQVCLSLQAADCVAGGRGPWGDMAQLPVGSNAKWRIIVTNTGGVALTGVTLADSAEPSCVVSAGFDLAVGEAKPFYCSTIGLTTDKTNTATATVPPPRGTPGGTPATIVPSGPATARVFGLTMTKQVCTSDSASDCGSGGPGPWAAAGSGPLNSTAYWRVVLVNTGTLDLSGIVIQDEGEDGCDRTAVRVNAGATETVYCSTANVTSNKSNLVRGNYTRPDGSTAELPPVTATYSVYGLQLVKEVCQSEVATDCQAGGGATWGPETVVPIGGPAYWRIRALNVGSTELTNITLTDASESDCQAKIDAVPPFTLTGGDSRAFFCGTASVTGIKTNTVSGKYTPPSKPPADAVPSTATAKPYGMTLTKEVCQSTVAAACGPTGAGPWGALFAGESGATAYWRITARNVGAVILSDVSVNDTDEPGCAGAAGTFDLGVGERRAIYCSTSGVTANKSNTASAAFTPPGKNPQTTPDTMATFNVYGMTLVKEVCAAALAVDCAPDGTGPWVAATTVPSGADAYWRITAKNTGNTVLTAITLRDTGEAACQTAIDAVGPFSLTEGDSRVFYCKSTALTADKTNTAEGTFTTPSVPPKDVPPTTAIARIHGITLEKEVCAGDDCEPDGPWTKLASGPFASTAHWRITVVNVGTVPLSQVHIDDAAEATCRQSFDMAAGETKHVYCASAGLTANKTNTAIGRFFPPDRPPGHPFFVTDPSSAAYEVGAKPPTPSPTPTPVPVPVTGVPVGRMLPVGSGLILFGALLLFFARRRADLHRN